MSSADDEKKDKAAETQEATDNFQQRMEVIESNQACVDVLSRLLCFRLE